MKTLIITIFGCYYIFASNQPEKFTATFGRLGSDCIGRGICGFQKVSTEGSNNFISIIDSTMYISINLDKLAKNEYLKIFGNTEANYLKSKLIFKQTDELQLSKAEKETLGIENIYSTIQSQEVPITKLKREIKFCLKLK